MKLFIYLMLFAFASYYLISTYNFDVFMFILLFIGMPILFILLINRLDKLTK